MLPPHEGESIVLLGPGRETGWEHIGGGGFKIENGVATSHGGRGVLVRFPDPGDNGDAPAATGYQVEIYKVINDSNQGMGAIDNFAKPIDNVPAKPAGEWNTFEITCRGQRYRVELNGEQVTTFKGDRALEGYIGLQNHDPESIVQFRNVRIAELEQ